MRDPFNVVDPLPLRLGAKKPEPRCPTDEEVQKLRVEAFEHSKLYDTELYLRELGILYPHFSY